jgi:transposase InsO family protein
MSVQDELMGVDEPLTHFGHSLSLLGINHSRARSPQSKGRMERLWGTLQTRLPVELSLNRCIHRSGQSLPCRYVCRQA